MPPARQLPASVPVHHGHAAARHAPLPLIGGTVVTVGLLATFIATASAFWLCVPGIVLAAGIVRTRHAAAVVTVLIGAAAAIPLVCLDTRPLPSPVLAVIVVACTSGIVTAMRERSERAHETLRGVALSDPLTGLANRHVLLSRADYEISRHIRERRTFAVVMLDLDGFKLLNDRFGHAAGDELLCDVADALAAVVRAQDTVARLGGDEFCILAPETDAQGAAQLVDRAAYAVGEATEGVRGLSASLGVSLFPVDARTSPQLIDVADQRLLDAKRKRYRRHGVHRRAA